jgi:DNA-binding transcriptional regulator YbjK
MASTATGTATDERTRRTQIVKAAETSLAQLGEQRFEMKQVAPARLPAEDLS